MAKPFLTLIFRDKRKANHSIERLFGALEPHFAAHYSVKRVVLPCQPSGIGAIIRNIRHARREARGVIHITGDAHYLIPFLPRGRSVLTIHDCKYLQALQGWKRVFYRWFWFSLPLRRAGAVTTVSGATRSELQRLLGVDPQRINVVPNCLIPGLTPTNRSFDTDRPRILQIGGGHNKNLDTLIRAVAGLSCELHLVGPLAEGNRLLLEKHGVAYRQEESVTDQRMAEIYHECDILFFASRYEGFGLPILEAQAVGIPVITSNRLSMPEVAGPGGAVLVTDPESEVEVRNAVLRILQDDQLRAELRSKGFSNITLYQPEQIVRKYIQVYDSSGLQA